MLAPVSDLIYVTNFGSGSVSVIDGSNNDKKLTDITIGGSPLAISLNPITSILYVTNEYSHTISEIYKDTRLAGVFFNIRPSDVGYLICNQTKIQDHTYLRYSFGQILDCVAKPNSQFAFSSWAGDLAPANNGTEIAFKVSRYGNLTGNFVNSVAITFPKQYWDNLYAVLLSVIIPALAAWSIPAIAGYFNRRRHRKYMRKYMAEIIQIHDMHQKEYLKILEDKRNEIGKILTEGKITESQYEILNERISEYYDESPGQHESQE